MANAEKDCYGKMFPPVIKHPDNVTVAGKVLSYRMERPGMLLTDRSTKTRGGDASPAKSTRRAIASQRAGYCWRLRCPPDWLMNRLEYGNR